MEKVKIKHLEIQRKLKECQTAIMERKEGIDEQEWEYEVKL
jgi:hypothetical protein